MNRYSMCAFSAMLMLGASAMAQTNRAPQAAAPVQSQKDKLICHTDDEVGSRISKHKVCMTADQWRAASRNNEEWLDKRTQELGRPG